MVDAFVDDVTNTVVVLVEAIVVVVLKIAVVVVAGAELVTVPCSHLSPHVPGLQLQLQLGK